MRGSIFSLRSGANSVVGSPVQTPASAPPAPQTQPHASQPNSRPDSGVYVADVEPLSLPQSAAGDTPLPSVVNTSRSRPLSRLGLTAFRKQSPAPRARDAAVVNSAMSHVPTPPASPAPGAGSVSYLDGLSLRLGEAVSKALLVPSVAPTSMGMGIAKAAHVATASGAKAANGFDGDMVLKGKKPLPAGRGRSLGALIAGELQSASQDAFLHRAVLRLLQRPLSVLLTNLTTQVTNLILAPEFAYVSSIPSLNPTQVHALALAHFASELLETFDAVGLGRSSHRNQAAPDGLRSDKEALESVVSKVVGPFLATIKRDVNAAVLDFERDAAAVGQLEKTLLRIAPVLGRVTFAGEPNQSQFVQSLLAHLEIGTIWGCLMALADRSLPRPSIAAYTTASEDRGADVRRSASASELRNRSLSDASLSRSGEQSPSPADYVNQLPSYVTPPDTPQVAPVREVPVDGREKEKRQSSGSNGKVLVSSQTLPASPPTPASKKLSLAKLPSLRPLTSSRAPSPPQMTSTTSSEGKVSLSSSTSTASSMASAGKDPPNGVLGALRAIARDTLTVSNAIKRLPLPLEGGLARDAVDEATREMTGWLAFIEYLASTNNNPSSPATTLESRVADIEQLMRKTRGTPMLVAMPLLLRVALATSPSARALSDVAPDTIAGWICLSEAEYRETCLSGFRKADECAPIVGKAFLRTRMAGALGWMKEWVERSTTEEEEDSTDDEEPPF